MASQLDEALEVLAGSDDWDNEEESVEVALQFAFNELLDKHDGDISHIPVEEVADYLSNRISALVVDFITVGLERKGLIEISFDEDGEIVYSLTEAGKIAKGMTDDLSE